MGIEGGGRFESSAGWRIEATDIERRPELGNQGRPELAPDERAMRRRMIGGVFSSLGAELLAEGVISELELFQRDDTYAYFRLTDRPTEVVRLFGASGHSNDREMVVSTNILDYAGLQKVREHSRRSGTDFVGFDEEAVVRSGVSAHRVDGYSVGGLRNVVGRLAEQLKRPQGKSSR